MTKIRIMAKKLYMNLKTGTIDDYEGWNYTDENGTEVNAVDRGEVIEINASQIASALGKIKTPKKAAASRENGKKGGRPKKEEKNR